MNARFVVIVSLIAALLVLNTGAVFAQLSPTAPSGWDRSLFEAAAEAQTERPAAQPQIGPGVVIVVTTTNPAANPGDGFCSLIEAINNANADADTSGGDCPAGSGPDTVHLAAAATYALATVNNSTDGDNGLPSITSVIEVTGNGSIIERSLAGGTPAFRLLHVSPGASLTLNDLTLRNGLSSAGGQGGAIRNQGGTLVLNGCVVRDNRAVSSSGGAIYNRAGVSNASVLLVNSQVISNTADVSGGGLYTVASSNLTATLTISNSLVNYNRAIETAGGIRSTAVSGSSNYGNFVNVLSSEVSHNVTTNAAVMVGGGGIINNYAELLVADSTISHNRAETGSAFGGGLINTFGNAQIVRSAIIHNTAAAVSGPFPAGGGGVVNSDGAMVIANSTLSGNSAVGGSNGGALLATNFFGSTPSSVTIVNTTISQNNADAAGGAVAAFNFAGGQPITITFTNSIVSANTAGDARNCTAVTAASILSNDYNLEDLNTCSFGQPNDLVNTAPLLGVLQNNGGPTQTHALLPGSPAIDTGNNSVCSQPPVSGVDQRGVGRPVGSTCDRGAYEAEAPTAVELARLAAHRSNVMTVWPTIVLLALMAAVSLGLWTRRRGLVNDTKERRI